MDGKLPPGTSLPRGLPEISRIKWPLVPARDIFDLKYGKALVENTRSAGETPVYGSNGQCGSHNKALFSGPGVILGRKGQGPLGVEWTNKDYWVIDTAYSLSLRRADVDLKYSYFMIKFVGLNHLKDGTSNPSLSRDAFGAQAFPLPPITEQIAIRDLLGALDSKIELNRRMAETLEAIARSLFKSWFVDFDPVRAKVEGRPTGLRDELAALFPSAMVQGPRGELPEGWAIRPLSEFASATRGLSYKGDGLVSTGLPLHNLNSVYEGGGYKREGLKFYAGPYAPRHEIRPGDIIVANTEQGHERRLIGFAAIVPASLGEGIFSQHLYRLRLTSTSPVSVQWLCHLLNAPTTHGVVSGYANGSTVNMLPIEALQEPVFATPPKSLVQAFDAVAQVTHERIEKCFAESGTLATLRDTLLPKLISGELRITDAEQRIAAA